MTVDSKADTAADEKKDATQVTDQDYSSWVLPDVTSTTLFSSAEKEERERKDQRFRKSKKPKKTGPVDEAAGESIEIVETIDETFKPLTAEQLQEITEAAEKEGYDAGYEKGIEAGEVAGEERGYKTGLEKADKKVIERCERVEHIIEALLIPLQTERKKLETLMVDMICQLTEAVVLRELALDSSQIIKLVDEALNAVPTGSDKFTLYLNEQDIELVKSHVDDQSDKQCNYYVDENLLPGGCRLETKNSLVSNSVEQRLSKVIDDFSNKRIAGNEESIEEAKEKLEQTVQEHTADKKSAQDNTVDKEPSLEDDNLQNTPSQHSTEQDTEQAREKNTDYSAQQKEQQNTSAQTDENAALENENHVAMENTPQQDSFETATRYSADQNQPDNDQTDKHPLDNNAVKQNKTDTSTNVKSPLESEQANKEDQKIRQENAQEQENNLDMNNQSGDSNATI